MLIVLQEKMDGVVILVVGLGMMKQDSKEKHREKQLWLKYI
jgi:hypothetical protein